MVGSLYSNRASVLVTVAIQWDLNTGLGLKYGAKLDNVGDFMLNLLAESSKAVT
jgi:hypothetical protein